MACCHILMEAIRHAMQFKPEGHEFDLKANPSQIPMQMLEQSQYGSAGCFRPQDT